jgi:hypothetical protein
LDLSSALRPPVGVFFLVFQILMAVVLSGTRPALGRMVTGVIVLSTSWRLVVLSGTVVTNGDRDTRAADAVASRRPLGHGCGAETNGRMQTNRTRGHRVYSTRCEWFSATPVGADGSIGRWIDDLYSYREHF